MGILLVLQRMSFGWLDTRSTRRFIGLETGIVGLSVLVGSIVAGGRNLEMNIYDFT